MKVSLLTSFDQVYDFISNAVAIGVVGGVSDGIVGGRALSSIARIRVLQKSFKIVL